MDALILFAAYFIGIIKWKNGYKPARFFLIGCSVLFIGFILNHFMTVDTKVGFFLTIILVYSVQFSAVIEMMFFSLALSDKVRTITKEREQLKDNLNKELEQKVKERTEELNTFVYRVSHDLKGPLNSITKLTKLGVKDSNNAQEYFDHINKTSVRLEGIVKEFLGISRAKEGKVIISSIDFNAIVETILNGLQELDYFKKSSIKIHINQEYDFLFDESLISSIIQNLFENALKYQRSEPYHHQVILGIEVKSDQIIIRVKDNGKGIKKESHQKVFEMFHRESVETQGSGLGLYIIKSIVEKFKGSILLDSEEGIGTSIQVKLPNSSPGAKRNNPSYQREFVAS
jgi:signal transduction histidine kinase